jgi:large subunit ribosomal protein L30
VTQTRSTISHIHRNRATIRALGLKRIGDTVEVPDNDATRGMVRQVRFLVSVEEVAETGKADGGARANSAQRGDEPASERADVPARARTGSKAAPGRSSSGDQETTTE